MTVECFHGMTPLKYWIFQVTEALPSFNKQGYLYVAKNRETAEEFARLDKFGWDQIAHSIATSDELKNVCSIQPSVEYVSELDLTLQIRSLIAQATEHNGESIDTICKSIAGAFGVSSSKLRKYIHERDTAYYVFRFEVDEKNLKENTSAGELDHGHKIKIMGREKVKDAKILHFRRLKKHSYKCDVTDNRIYGLDMSNVKEISHIFY